MWLLIKLFGIKRFSMALLRLAEHVSGHGVRVPTLLFCVFLELDKGSQFFLIPQSCLLSGLHLVLLHPLDFSDLLNFGNNCLEVLLMLVVGLGLSFGARVYNSSVLLFLHCFLHVNICAVQIVF